MKTAGRKRNIPMYAAGVLLCLTLLSMYLVSGLYAKYTTTGGADDAARVATFYLEAGDDLQYRYIQMDAIPGGSQQWTLSITNKSEVKMKYTLTIRRETENIPLTLKLEKNGSSDVYTATDGVYTIEANLAPGIQTDRYTLTIDWPESDAAIDENLAYMGMVDALAITVNATQID